MSEAARFPNRAVEARRAAWDVWGKSKNKRSAPKEKHNPYYSDYHVWNDSEVGHYQQWSRENHRDSGRDFRKLPPEEQKEYWTWRHSSRGQRSSLVSLACL